MNNIEFSNEFDVLVDSYRRFKAFDDKEELDSLEFNEYEKSVFLTEAQNQIVVELYSGRNEKGVSFESTEEVRVYLRTFLKEASLDEVNAVKTDYRSKIYRIPEDCMFITYDEALIEDCNAGCSDGMIVQSVPITHDELHKVLDNPFRKPNGRRTVRVDIGDGLIEVFSEYNIREYNIKYVSRPTPIVLRDFSEVTIEGCSKCTECKLDSVLHRPLLERAVRLALMSKGYSESK